ncbi:MAG: aminotransferase class I/II-fold pyridoxal phosphate-dependent enzyme, partial [Sulfurimonas sp.]
LRSGFIAGDEKILKDYMKFRTYIGCASPLPLQHAAAAAWSEESHVESARTIYKENLQLAREILGVDVPKATFYVWLEVDDALEVTKKLYEHYHVKVLPGEFLSREDKNSVNPGKGFIRIALVEDPKKTKDALQRIKECLSE